jgi:uncharacterized membrane protein YhaH (DUF805 family)
LDFLKGRMNRATYWLAIGIGLAVFLLLRVLMRGDASINEVVLIILAVPRLHDIGRSGWWVLAPIAFELGTVALGLAFLTPEGFAVAAGLLTLATLALLLWLGVVPGQPNENRFGPAPPAGLDFRRRPDA